MFIEISKVKLDGNRNVFALSDYLAETNLKNELETRQELFNLSPMYTGNETHILRLAGFDPNNRQHIDMMGTILLDLIGEGFTIEKLTHNTCNA